MTHQLFYRLCNRPLWHLCYPNVRARLGPSIHSKEDISLTRVPQVVLTVRVLALYQRYRGVKIMLYVLFLATWGSSLGLVISVQIVGLNRLSLTQFLTTP
jgi:hypothetical protein